MLAVDKGSPMPSATVGTCLSIDTMWDVWPGGLYLDGETTVLGYTNVKFCFV
jgi:hypothetical protein